MILGAANFVKQVYYINNLKNLVFDHFYLGALIILLHAT